VLFHHFTVLGFHSNYRFLIYRQYKMKNSKNSKYIGNVKFLLKKYLFSLLQGTVQYLKNWKVESPSIMTAGNKKLSLRQPILLTILKVILMGSVLYAWLIFGFDVPLRQRESVILFFMNPHVQWWLTPVNSDSPLQMMRGVVTLGE
jgi:hypothetical protein